MYIYHVYNITYIYNIVITVEAPFFSRNPNCFTGCWWKRSCYPCSTSSWVGLHGLGDLEDQNGCHHSCSQRFKRPYFLQIPIVSQKRSCYPFLPLPPKVCLYVELIPYLLGQFCSFECSASAQNCGEKLSDWKDLLAAKCWNPFQAEECCGLLDVHLHHLHIEPTVFTPAIFTIFSHLQTPRCSPLIGESQHPRVSHLLRGKRVNQVCLVTKS